MILGGRNVAIAIALSSCMSCSDREEKKASQSGEERPESSNQVEPLVSRGMSYDTALQALTEFGAEDFICGYKYIADDDSKYSWHTLPNGMSIHLYARTDKSNLLTVSRLKICDSTSLFCRKGETWYDLEKLQISDNRVIPTWKQDEKEPAIFLSLGMSNLQASDALRKAGCLESKAPSEIHGKSLESAKWKCYIVAGHQLLISSNPSDHLDQLVIAGRKLKKNSRKVPGNWITLEVVNLTAPLKDKWN